MKILCFYVFMFFGIASVTNASIIGFTETDAVDKPLQSRFLVNVGLDDFRVAPGLTSINQAFSIGGVNWEVSGNLKFTVAAGVTSELLEITGVYNHIIAPHSGEITNNSIDFSATFNAFDVAKNSLGQPINSGVLRGNLFGSSGTFLDLHEGGSHLDTFSIAYVLGASNLIDTHGPKLFDNVFFDFKSAHPPGTLVPLPAAVWLFGSGIFSLFGMKRYLNS